MYYNYAVNHINSNLFRNLQISELTNILGISQPYLYRIFKDKCNLSPKQKIDDMKIEEAKKLLLKTNMPISDIAYSLGYNTPQDFSKFFKKNTGKTPTDLRESH